MNIKPLNGRVLIKVIKESKSDSGIILPESNSSKSIKAEVIAVGSNISLKDNSEIKMDLKIGNIVFCPKWSGTVVSEEHAKDEYIIIKYEDLLGVEGE